MPPGRAVGASTRHRRGPAAQDGRNSFPGDKVVENAVEQHLLRRILTLRKCGLGAMRISQALRKTGKHPRTRREWWIGSAVAILRTLATQGKDPKKS